MTFKRIQKFYTNVSELIGKTLISVEGLKQGSEEVVFTTEDNTIYVLKHEQVCCEYVNLEDVEGCEDDLVGAEILMSECSTNIGLKDGYPYAWSFYRFATVKGYVNLRWYGESNGNYSEEVDFFRYIN